MNVENYLQNKLEEWGVEGVQKFIVLYNSVDSERLRKLFSKSHYEVNKLFTYLNQRLQNGHYNAAQSRELIEWIERIEELQLHLKESNLAFEVNEYYKNLFESCNGFLQRTGGSAIPSNFRRIELYSIEPIFKLASNENVTLKDERRYKLKLIGEGSYAKVFKYKDPDYNKYFVLKRTKTNLDEKEKERFKREFDEMKKLNSPYIVEVYQFDEDKYEYKMEYIDYTIGKFIKENNNKLTLDERKKIIWQVLAAFDYIHSKGLLHRDISLSNILVKCYEDTRVIKIADFGLVKIPDSNLTSLNSEIKGSLNDISDLQRCGFDKYTKLHETYALCRLISFILTGSTKIDNIKNAQLKAFMEKGVNPQLDQRFKNVSEIKNALKFL